MHTKTRQRRILTSTENENLRGVIEDQKRDAREDEDFYPLPQSKPMDAQTKRALKVLKSGQPDSLSKYEINEREKEASLLKEWLIKRMVRRSGVMQMPSINGVQNYEFRKAVNLMAEQELSSEFNEKAERYKFIMRSLKREQDGNLESIRPS